MNNQPGLLPISNACIEKPGTPRYYNLLFCIYPSRFQNTETLINNVWNLRPDKTITEKKFHVIHIFNHNNIRWLGGNYSFTLKNQNQLITQIDSLISQLEVFKS